ncbi:MAG: sulfatase-like hydrolase/transferase [Alistipes sp.]|nr:sulfatase-like hydrolase/transferase [Candidatus Alistipes equi]
MKRNLTAVFVIVLATIIFMVAGRICFLFINAGLSSECTIKELLCTFIYGLKLDITVTGYICAPLFIVLLWNLWLPALKRGVIKTYLIMISVVGAAMLSSNIIMYQYWGFPLDSTIIQYLKTPSAAFLSATWAEAIKSIALFALLSFVMILLYSIVVKIYKPSRTSSGKYLWAIILIICCGVDFLAIRGSVTASVANVSQVYFSNNNFLNHAAVNPVFSFLNSLTNADDKGEQYMFYTEAERESLFSKIRGEKSNNTLSVLRPGIENPNVILIIAESFGTTAINHQIHSRCVAPNFQRLKNNGIFFSNAYASSFRTDRGVIAILSGFPAQTTSSIMKTPAKSRHLPSISGALQSKGYHTSYVHGGDLNFTDMSSYLYGTGFDKLTGLKDLNLSAKQGKWGYKDDIMADYFLDHIQKQEEPFMTVWQTLSSHEPFDVPDMGIEDKMLNSMAFADRSIAKVVDTLSTTDIWERSIVIIVADHAYAFPYGIAHSAPERHQIPILITGGAIGVNEVIEKPVSQTDLAATLLCMVGTSSEEFIFSRNALGELPTFGYYVFNNGFGVVDKTGVTVYDYTQNKVIEGTESSSRMVRGRVMLQTTYTQIGKL